MPDYSYDDLKYAYRRAGVGSGRIVYLTGNFGRIGGFTSRVKSEIFAAHLAALQDLLTPSGTLVVPTHSFSLANTDKPFDYEKTPGESGPFAEYIRRTPGAIRQFHPFSSSTALGSEAFDICGQCSRHVYGLHTPFHRMVERDALFLSVGKALSRTISLIHHAEFMMGVPYRYTKEFQVPCVSQGQCETENFYLYVLYRACDIERDRNIKFTDAFRSVGTIESATIGRSYVESVSMRDYFDNATKILASDIYAWLRSPPRARPYTV